MTQRFYVQYGCGLVAPNGWINFDASPRLRFEQLPGVGALAGALGKRLFPRNIRFGDIVGGLPVSDGSVDGVYASHVLEHLSRNEVGKALSNTYRMLRPGGIFRLVVPDLAWRAERYVQHRREGGKAADAFIESLNVGTIERPRGLEGILRATFGHSGHRWMYDFELMSQLLEQAQFVEIRRSKFHDSGDPMFDAVEDRGRYFEDGAAELAMQARRPGR
jgi:predicted SAM-dependent methyltransferase